MANSHSLDLELSSSQYAAIADASQTGLDLTGTCSFEAWVKIEQLPSTATTSFQIIGKTDTGANKRAYLFYLTNTDKLRMYWSKDGTASNYAYVTATNATVVSGDVGGWVHLAGTLSPSTGAVVLYKNGSSLTVDTIASAGTYDSIYNNDIAFSIGTRFSSGTPGEFFDGLIDEVRVWNDIRTPTEIANNYQTELVGNETGLVGYWKFNNGYLDETANNNDLTAYNTPTFSTDVPFSDSTTTSTTTSTSTTTTSTSSSTSTTTTLAGSGGLAFGEQNPNQGETAVAWSTFGGTGLITGDASWGKLQLEMNEYGYSKVYDYGNASARTISLASNRYGTGQGTATLQIRGQDTLFGMGDGTPTWEDYTTPTNKTWRYIQVRAIKQ